MFARVLVEVEVDQQFPDRVQFKNEKGMVVDQKAHYAWRPIVCKQCSVYGHSQSECVRK